jgi:hypothetical protein
MRTARLVAALLGLVLTVLAAGSTAGHAADPDLQRDAGRALLCKEVEGKHRVCVSGKEIGDTNKFVAYGKVTTYKGRTIKLQRRACGTCGWKFYKETRTSEATGWFRTRIYPGKVGSKVCYRVVVPATSRYELTRVVVGCIRTTRS